MNIYNKTWRISWLEKSKFS